MGYSGPHLLCQIPIRSQSIHKQQNNKKKRTFIKKMVACRLYKYLFCTGIKTTTYTAAANCLAVEPTESCYDMYLWNIFYSIIGN